MGQWISLEAIGLALDGIAALAVVLWVVWARKRLAADTAFAREQAARSSRAPNGEALARGKETELARQGTGHAQLVEAERASRELEDAARATDNMPPSNSGRE